MLWAVNGLNGVTGTAVPSTTLAQDNPRINTADATQLSPSTIEIFNFVYADNATTVACEDATFTRGAATTLLVGKPIVLIEFRSVVLVNCIHFQCNILY